MIIQILLVPALVLAVILSLRSRASLRGQARRKIFAAVTVLAGVLAVLFPSMLQALAYAVGVIYLVGSTSARFREQEARIVLLARQVALSDAALRHVEAVATGSEETADQLPVAVHRGVEQRPTPR
jgi:Tfp pilus assembly protein PilN